MNAGAHHPAAATATGTDRTNVVGQAIAINVFSAVRWWGRLWLPVLFLLARLFPGRSTSGIARLSFIHFARWTLVSRLPYNGPPQARRGLRYPRLYFESNFNGGWEEYIDAFSYVLTREIKTVWGSSYGFPGPLPTGPFKAYIRRNEFPVDHFYSAYPDGTTTTVLAGLELRERLAPLRREADDLGPEAFALAWRAFLTDVQRCL